MKLGKKNNPAPVEDNVASGGAVIADRFKLDGDPRAAKSGEEVGKKSTMAALVCSLIALAMLGALAAMMYFNWEAIKDV